MIFAARRVSRVACRPCPYRQVFFPRRASLGQSAAKAARAASRRARCRSTNRPAMKLVRRPPSPTASARIRARHLVDFHCIGEPLDRHGPQRTAKVLAWEKEKARYAAQGNLRS